MLTLWASCDHLYHDNLRDLTASGRPLPLSTLVAIFNLSVSVSYDNRNVRGSCAVIYGARIDDEFPTYAYVGKKWRVFIGLAFGSIFKWYFLVKRSVFIHFMV